VLVRFAGAHQITFPMLSDKGSAVIRRYGNPQHPATSDDGRGGPESPAESLVGHAPVGRDQYSPERMP